MKFPTSRFVSSNKIETSCSRAKSKMNAIAKKFNISEKNNANAKHQRSKGVRDYIQSSQIFT